jgi:hypothetical protein
MAAGTAAGQHPAASHPGDDYYVEPVSGAIQRQSNPIAAGLLAAAGYIGPMDWNTAQATLQFVRGAGQASDVNVAHNAGVAAKDIATGNLPNPLAGIAGSMEAFFSAVTDGKLWRSLGWVLLGIILIMAGVYLWIVPGVAGKALAVKSAVA